jgi:hypothetical protein
VAGLSSLRSTDVSHPALPPTGLAAHLSLSAPHSRRTPATMTSRWWHDGKGDPTCHYTTTDPICHSGSYPMRCHLARAPQKMWGHGASTPSHLPPHTWTCCGTSPTWMAHKTTRGGSPLRHGVEPSLAMPNPGRTWLFNPLSGCG